MGDYDTAKTHIYHKIRVTRESDLLTTLAQRFRAHPERHPGVVWDDIRARLEAHPAALATLTRPHTSSSDPRSNSLCCTSTCHGSRAFGVG